MFKETVYHLVVKGSHGKSVNGVFDRTIMLLIVLNIIALILETNASFDKEYNGLFNGFEVFSVVVFTLEYLARLYVSDLTHPANSYWKSALKFAFSLLGLVDLLAILPFYAPFFINTDLRILRIMRLFRFLRILKITRYDDSIKLILSVFMEKKTELGVTIFITFIMVFISSVLMYNIEGEVQPHKFPNVISCFWWAIATLTTVGYGDVYPVTGFGKFVSGLMALLGIGLVALPTGLISTGFLEKMSQRKSPSKKCPHCGKYLK